jgi:hypothetical protein
MITPRYHPRTFSDELVNFVLNCPRLIKAVNLTSLSESKVSTGDVMFNLLAHYFNQPDYRCVYYTTRSIRNISKYVNEYVHKNGFPLNLTFVQQTILLHYLHGKSPEKFETSMIKFALAAIDLNRRTWRSDKGNLPVIGGNRYAADEYMIEMLPKTFAKMRDAGVDPKNMTYQNIWDIIIHNTESAPSKFTIDHNTLAAHIKEFGFPLNLSFEEHTVLIRILHNKSLDYIPNHNILGLKRAIMCARKSKFEGELIEKLQCQSDNIEAYVRSIQVYT